MIKIQITKKTGPKSYETSLITFENKQEYDNWINKKTNDSNGKIVGIHEDKS